MLTFDLDFSISQEQAESWRLPVAPWNCFAVFMLVQDDLQGPGGRDLPSLLLLLQLGRGLICIINA